MKNPKTLLATSISIAIIAICVIAILPKSTPPPKLNTTPITNGIPSDRLKNDTIPLLGETPSSQNENKYSPALRVENSDIKEARQELNKYRSTAGFFNRGELKQLGFSDHEIETIQIVEYRFRHRVLESLAKRAKTSINGEEKLILIPGDSTAASTFQSDFSSAIKYSLGQEKLEILLANTNQAHLAAAMEYWGRYSMVYSVDLLQDTAGGKAISFSRTTDNNLDGWTSFEYNLDYLDAAYGDLALLLTKN